jgi:hypothetical protein
MFTQEAWWKDGEFTEIASNRLRFIPGGWSVLMESLSLIVDVTITWGAMGEWNVDWVCEAGREEEEGECELREGKHSGEGGSQGEAPEMKEGE